MGNHRSKVLVGVDETSLVLTLEMAVAGLVGIRVIVKLTPRRRSVLTDGTASRPPDLITVIENLRRESHFDPFSRSFEANSRPYLTNSLHTLLQIFGEIIRAKNSYC